MQRGLACKLSQDFDRALLLGLFDGFRTAASYGRLIGGGAFRRAMGMSLKGKGYAMKTKEGRKTSMQEAHRLAREMRDAAGQQWAQVRREGLASTASHRLPVSSAVQWAKNAPSSITPSTPRFNTPLR